MHLTWIAQSADTDGSETLPVVVSGVPTGASLSAGTDNGDGTWTLTPIFARNSRIGVEKSYTFGKPGERFYDNPLVLKQLKILARILRRPRRNSIGFRTAYCWRSRGFKVRRLKRGR